MDPVEGSACSRISNQKYHGIIDWRLGLDLARIAFNKEVFIDFSSDYWKDYLFNIANSFEGTEEVDKNIYTIINRRKKYLIVHPFWSEKYISELNETIDFDVCVNIIEVLNIFKE